MEGYRHHSLIVEDDDNQRALLSMLLEESDMEVLECASAEAAVSILDRIGESVCFLFTDEKLAGRMSGAALAAEAKDRFPQMDVVVNPAPCHQNCRAMPSSCQSLGDHWTCYGRSSVR